MLVVERQELARRRAAAPALHYTYGLSDAFNLLVDGGWSLVALNEKLRSPATPHTRPTNVTNVNVGVGLRARRPAVGAVGGVERRAATRSTAGTLDGTKFLPGFALALGLDYRLNRSWSVGVALRQHMLVHGHARRTRASRRRFARFEYVWGW